MTLENVKTQAKNGLWSVVPFNWGVKHFIKRDETSKAIKFFQYKTGRSVFIPECWQVWRQLQVAAMTASNGRLSIN
jgi:hypothetical protein